MVAAGRMKTMIWKGNWRRRGLISSATAIDPRQELLGLLGVARLGIHPDGDVRVIADIALCGAGRQRRGESAHLELRLPVEERDLPGARGINRRLAQCEQVLRVGVLLGLKT